MVYGQFHFCNYQYIFQGNQTLIKILKTRIMWETQTVVILKKSDTKDAFCMERYHYWIKF